MKSANNNAIGLHPLRFHVPWLDISREVTALEEFPVVLDRRWSYGVFGCEEAS